METLLEGDDLQASSSPQPRPCFTSTTIALTQQELVTVKQGGTVTPKASSHLFVIALARQQKRKS